MNPVDDRSYWQARAAHPFESPPLQGEVEADAVIIGAGYCGLSAAIALRDLGMRAVVLDRHGPGWGASGRNGGQVIPGFKPTLGELTRLYGEGPGRSLHDFGQASVAAVENLVRRFEIDCSFEQAGWIRAAHSVKAARALRQAADAARNDGQPLEFLDRSALASWLGRSRYHGGLRDPRGASLDPHAYALGLARGAAGLGARIHGGSEALAVTRHHRRWRVATPAGAVVADAVGIATDGYTGGLFPALADRLVHVGSYQVATRPLSSAERELVIRPGVVASDTKMLLRYFRLSPDGRLLMGGRGAFTDAVDPVLYAAIEGSIGEIYPALSGAGIDHRWEGRVALTRDGLPHLMRLADGVYFAGGFNGRGVAMATALGACLARTLLGRREGPQLRIESPLVRFPFHRFRLPVMNLMAQVMKLQDALGL